MKLLKSLYSLKQSSNNGHGTIDTFFVGIGSNTLYSDLFVYGMATVKQGLATCTDHDSTAVITLYADSVLRAG